MSPHSEEVIRNGSSNPVDDAPAAAGTNAPQPLPFDSNSCLSNDVPNGNHSSSSTSRPKNLARANGKDSWQQSRSSPYLIPAPLDDEFDLICVGFGPASLSVAVAMHDALAAGRRLLANGTTPKVLFIEKQDQFAWHSGMLLPGTKMQISFIKDLATLRDPRSEFTFLNYLQQQDRLVDFTNLNTFLPTRVEYEGYLRWCSSFFSRLVQFSQQVVSISPQTSKGVVRSFAVRSESVATGRLQTFRARHVLVAAGGQPSLPENFPLKHPRVIHSSQYANVIGSIFRKTTTPCRVVVVGAGQSAAEIFNNIAVRYPNSKTYLVMRQEFLRPSDDSPFINSVFNPEFIGSIFPKSATYRKNHLAEARATNYGVVRLELIEALYERMYEQRRELGADDSNWPHRIMGGKEVFGIETRDETLKVKIQDALDGELDGFLGTGDEEVIEADLVIAATGYQRNAHVDMLKDAWSLLPKASPGRLEIGQGISGWNVQTEQGERNIAVGRDYRVTFAPGTVADDAGVWLQGCCEGTHGLSDTLLSVLATRSGEIVDSIFTNH